MGTLLLSQHQFSEALEWGLKARRLAPHSANALGIIADALVELGRYDEAAGTVQQMVDLRPNLSSYARVSYLRELSGDVPGAVDAMRKAVDAGGGVPENTAYARVLLGNLYFNTGRLQEAETQYRAALAIFPNYVHGLAALARVRAGEGRYAEAISLYRRAVDIFPTPEYVIALGDVQQAAGFHSQAEGTYELAAAEQRLYESNGVNLDAELALFDADYGRDLAQALVAAERAIHERPGIRSADALAWTLFKAGNSSQALALERDAHRLGTQDALLFFHLGMIEAALGMSAKAEADLKSALKINPYFSILRSSDARNTLDRLDV
jgi:tetratricopeptide (TPR) repeat protein